MVLRLAPRIAKLRQWREHLFERLRQPLCATGDPVLSALLEELKGDPDVSGLSLLRWRENTQACSCRFSSTQDLARFNSRAPPRYSVSR